MALGSHPHHLFPVLGLAACCLPSVRLSICPSVRAQQGLRCAPDQTESGSSFPRHLSKPLDPNPAAFLALSPAFSLFVMLDGKLRQMLYFGKTPGMTDNRQQWMLGWGVGCRSWWAAWGEERSSCQSFTQQGWQGGELGGRSGSVCCAELSWGKATEQEG